MPEETGYRDEHGGVFVQEAPGKEMHFLGNCIDLGDLPKPKGTRTPIWCMVNGVWKTKGFTTSAPDTVSLPITSLMEKTADWLEKMAERACPFWLHAIQTDCGVVGTYGNWERVHSYEAWGFSDDVISNMAMREPANPTTRVYTLDCDPARVDSRELTMSRQTTAETEALNDVWVCPPACGGECGAEIAIGDVAKAGADAASYLLTANVQGTNDGGLTWVALATDPFEAGENVIAGECYAYDKNTTRYFVVRDTDLADNLEGAYSDDGGLNWTNVDIGVTNEEATTGSQSLFVFEKNGEYMWVATDDGRVFFSSDYGATWTDQTSALTASGATALNAIHFWTTKVGFAVGDSDTVIYTLDGGDNWIAGTATGGGVNLLTIQMQGTQQLIVGDSAGAIYTSWNRSTAWTQTWTPPAAGGAVNCISMANEVCGLMIWDTSAPVGTVYHTTNGGTSWRALNAVTNDGLNSVIMPVPWLGYAVGEAESGTAVILKITAP